MTTARSSFSVARLLPVYRNIMRRNRGSAAFYGVLGFICLPVQYLLTILQNQGELNYDWMSWSLFGTAKVYNGFSLFFFTVLMLIVPLITAVNLFSYLHNRRSVDVYHSLPLTRAELFAASSLAGVTLIWIPLMVNFVVTAGISLLLPGVSIAVILLDLFCWMVATLAIFAITAFCAVQLGTDFDTVIFSLGLNGVFAAIYLMFMALAEVFIYGFTSNMEVLQIAYRLSPVSTIIGRMALGESSYDYIANNNFAILAWLLVSIAVLVAGAWVYSRRKSEQAEAVGEMGPLQLFMRFAGTLVGGTGLGTLFCAVFDIDPEYNRVLALFSIAIGSLIVYFIGDVILSRSVRSIPRALPVAALTAAGVCALVSVMMFDLFGIGKWQPKVEEISSVSLNYYNSRFSDQPRFGNNNSKFAFHDPEAVALVLAAQNGQIEQHFAGTPEPDYYNNLSISYELKNGKRVDRRYPSLYPSVTEGLIALEVDDELISNSHPAFFAESSMISKVDVTNALGNANDTLSLTAEQKQQLLVALREDLLSQPLSELKEGAVAVCTLNLEFRYARPQDLDRYAAAVSETVLYDFKGEDQQGSEDYYAYSSTMLTASYQKTLALLREFGAETSLENDWTQVKAAYAFPFNRGYSGSTTVTQTDLERVLQTQSDVENFIRDYSEVYGLSFDSFVFSPMELTAAKASLTSIAPTYGEAFAVVGVATGTDEEEITGYFLIPVSALPSRLKEPVRQMVKEYYGTYAVEGWGYGEVTTSDVTTSELVDVTAQ